MIDIKFNILTVPHSGSRFLMKLLKICDLHRFSTLDEVPVEREDYKFNHFVPDPNNEDSLNNIYSYLEHLPVVCTLRNPYDVAISWMSRKKSLRTMISTYRQFIIFAENHKVLLFDVACPVKHRVAKSKEVLQYCNVYDSKFDDMIYEFSETWKVVGSVPSNIKQNYELSNELPNYDWSRFEGLEKWYNRKIAEFNYDNIA